MWIVETRKRRTRMNGEAAFPWTPDESAYSVLEEVARATRIEFRTPKWLCFLGGIVLLHREQLYTLDYYSEHFY